MNKLIITTIAISLVSAVFANTSNELAKIKKDLVEFQKLAETRPERAQVNFYAKVFRPLNSNPCLVGEEVKTFRKYVNSTCSKQGFYVDAVLFTKTNFWAHNLAKVAYDKEDLGNKIPYAVSLGLKYGVACDPMIIGEKQLAPEEYIGLLNENLDFVNGNFRTKYSHTSLDANCKRFQYSCIKAVKQYIRSQGKSFVTKNGVNPCADLMTELNTALNAPYFNGLNEWLAKVGINARIDVSKLPTQDEVQSLRHSVLYAEKEPKGMNRVILRVCLGTAGFNQFVKEYNGEE